MANGFGPAGLPESPVARRLYLALRAATRTAAAESDAGAKNSKESVDFGRRRST